MDPIAPPQISPQAQNANAGQVNSAPKKRDPWGVVVGINLLIFLVYSVLAFVTQGYAGIFTVFTYLYHVGILMVISFVLAFLTHKNKRDYNAAAYFVSGGIILVIGFGVCTYAFIVYGF